MKDLLEERDKLYYTIKNARENYYRTDISNDKAIKIKNDSKKLIDKYNFYREYIKNRRIAKNEREKVYIKER